MLHPFLKVTKQLKKIVLIMLKQKHTNQHWNTAEHAEDHKP